MSLIKITCFTDGSCFWKTKKGGWAFLAILPNREVIANGGLRNTSVGRCELIALIKLLERFKDTQFFMEVYVDSQYVVFLLLKNWLHNWIRTGAIKDKKNQDLLLKLWEIYINFYQNRLSLIWTRGHTSNQTIGAQGNFIVDKLCNYKNNFVLIEDDCNNNQKFVSYVKKN